MNPEQAAKLREPFPPEAVGKLPKGGIQLDYVGHAAVTDRLLLVDPEWSWEPMAMDELGLPAVDSSGNLWIRLTICGVTRIGVGDGPNAKERIGDALRNAAMRFGVALDLWGREDLTTIRLGPPETTDPEWVTVTMDALSSAQSVSELTRIGALIRERTDARQVSDDDKERLARAFREAATNLSEDPNA